MRARLAPGGWITVNLGAFGVQDPVAQAVAQTLACSLDADVGLARIPFSRNVMLYARAGRELPKPDTPAFHPASPVTPRTQPLELPGAWSLVAPSEEPPLTDDQNPIDILQMRSVLGGRQRFLQ